MSDQNNTGDPVRFDELKSLLASGVPVAEALRRVGEGRTAYIIETIEQPETQDNTKNCSLGSQYNGC